MYVCRRRLLSIPAPFRNAIFFGFDFTCKIFDHGYIIANTAEIGTE